MTPSEFRDFIAKQCEQFRADSIPAVTRRLVSALVKIANDPDCDRCQVAVNALAQVPESLDEWLHKPTAEIKQDDDTNT